MKAASELQDQIRRRAYELHEQRGRVEGRERDDWLQSELEVTQQKVKGSSRKL
jgi:hypothetical protein